MRSGQQQAVLLALLESLDRRGSWCGETHIQKAVYFLQEALNVPLELDFVFYKHGPFSFDLREVLGEMRANFVIDAQPRPPYGPSLEPGQSSKMLKKKFPNTIRRYQGQIKLVADFLAKKDVGDLEGLSTALYVTKKSPKASEGKRATKIVSLKPHISESTARRAVEEVDGMLKKWRGAAD